MISFFVSATSEHVSVYLDEDGDELIIKIGDRLQIHLDTDDAVRLSTMLAAQTLHQEQQR
jgi:hypothetical protein